jgi:hypothetical protein
MLTNGISGFRNHCLPIVFVALDEDGSRLLEDDDEDGWGGLVHHQEGTNFSPVGPSVDSRDQWKDGASIAIPGQYSEATRLTSQCVNFLTIIAGQWG